MGPPCPASSRATCVSVASGRAECSGAAGDIVVHVEDGDMCTARGVLELGQTMREGSRVSFGSCRVLCMVLLWWVGHRVRSGELCGLPALIWFACWRVAWLGVARVMPAPILSFINYVRVGGLS